MTLWATTNQLIRDLADQGLPDAVIAGRAGVSRNRVRVVLDAIPAAAPDRTQQHYQWWAALSRGTATWYRNNGRPGEERAALGDAQRFAQLARIAS